LQCEYRTFVDLAVGTSDLTVLKCLCPYFESGAICNEEAGRYVSAFLSAAYVEKI
jgi:hypothetical protein